MLLCFPESGGVVKHRDHSAILKFEVPATEFVQTMTVAAFPDLAVIEATFVLKEVAGRAVPSRKRKKAPNE